MDNLVLQGLLLIAQEAAACGIERNEKLFWILLLANVILFAVMQRGGLAGAGRTGVRSQPELNGDMIRLLPATQVSPAKSSSAAPAPALTRCLPLPLLPVPACAVPVPVRRSSPLSLNCR